MVAVPVEAAVQVHCDPRPQESSLRQEQAPLTTRYGSPEKLPQVEIVYVWPWTTLKLYEATQLAPLFPLLPLPLKGPALLHVAGGVGVQPVFRIGNQPAWLALYLSRR